MLIGIAIFIILFLTLALIRLDWALLILIAAFPAYLIRFNIGGLPLTLLEVMILIAFAVWFGKYFLPNFRDIIKGQKKRLPYPYSWEIILLLIISFGAAGIADFNPNALGIWKAYFFEPILFFILVINVFKNKTAFKKIFGALTIAMFVVSAWAIFQKITGLFIPNPFWAAAETRRVVSFFTYPNALGLYLAPLIMTAIGWLFSLSWNNVFNELGKKLLIITTVVISGLAIYFARSEGALIALAGSLVIFGLMANKKWRALTISCSLVVLTIVLIMPTLRGFVLTKMSLQDLSGEIRKQQWKETVTMLNNGRIVSGTGLNNYQATVKPYHQEGIFFNSDKLPNFDAVVWASSSLQAKYWQPVEIYLYPHNIFLNFWSELGLLGLLLFVWLFAKYLWQGAKLYTTLNKQKNPDRYIVLGLTTAMLTLLIHGLVDVPYFKNDLALIFWLLLAMLGILNLNYFSDTEQN